MSTESYNEKKLSKNLILHFNILFSLNILTISLIKNWYLKSISNLKRGKKKPSLIGNDFSSLK